MSIPSSYRPAREWLWLVLALILVGAIIVPAWTLTGTADSQAAVFAKWTPERLAKLFIGPEQAACYVCFAWAGFILLNRRREVFRQRTAFGLDLLPTDEGARILPEDARPLARKVDEAMQESTQRTAHLFETMNGLDTVKALGAEAWSRRKWESLTQAIAHNNMQTREITAFT